MDTPIKVEANESLQSEKRKEVEKLFCSIEDELTRKSVMGHNKIPEYVKKDELNETRLEQISMRSTTVTRHKTSKSP